MGKGVGVADEGPQRRVGHPVEICGWVGIQEEGQDDVEKAPQGLQGCECACSSTTGANNSQKKQEPEVQESNQEKSRDVSRSGWGETRSDKS